MKELWPEISFPPINLYTVRPAKYDTVEYWLKVLEQDPLNIKSMVYGDVVITYNSLYYIIYYSTHSKRFLLHLGTVHESDRI